MKAMLLRAMVVYATLAVVVSVPDIMGESTGSSFVQYSTYVHVWSMLYIDSEDRTVFVVY